MLRYAATAARMPRGRGAALALPRNSNALVLAEQQRPFPRNSNNLICMMERRFKSSNSNPIHKESASRNAQQRNSKQQQPRNPSQQKQQRQQGNQQWRRSNNNNNSNHSNGNGQRGGPRRNEASQPQTKPATTFLQKFKVGPPGASSSNTAAVDGPSKQATSEAVQSSQQQPFPTRPGSALQSNLHGSSNPEMEDTDLVAFFQKRLDNSQQSIKNNNNNHNKSNASLRQNHAKPRPNPSRHSSNGRNHNHNKPISPLGNNNKPPLFGGLRAAQQEVKFAQTNLDRAPTAASRTPKRAETASETASQDPAATGEANSATTTTTTTTSTLNAAEASPLRKFIQDLQKAKDNGSQFTAAKPASSTTEPNAPSWRRNKAINSRRPMPDPSSSSQQRNQQDPRQAQQQELKELNKLAMEMKQLQKKPARKVNNKPREVVLPLTDTTMIELSKLFGIKVDKLLKALRDMGEDPKRDDAYTIDTDMMEMVAMELDIKFIRPTRRQKEDNDHKQLMERRKVNEDDAETSAVTTAYQSLPTRPPVVCIMGHVDHGKTTLMDALRRRAGTTSTGNKKSKKAKGKKQKGSSGDVAGTEAGGITQIITAFQVPLGGQNAAITFLDTPGHAAFSAMRQSGSHAADILVLVVAADDGVSPQTVEIINFYKSIVKDSNGGISMVVAMNKIDKPGIDVEESRRRVENQLLEHGITPEGVASYNESEYGSPVQFFPISAKTGDGLEDLIEGLALQSEIMDLRADDNARAEGIVMDARVEQGLGVVADCIVRWGSIEKSDIVVSGTHSGKVRILKDVNDKTIKKGTPSQPVRIIGFKTPPKAGDPIVCVASEEVADDLIARRLAILEKKQGGDTTGDTNANFSQFIITGRESMTAFGTEKTHLRYGESVDLEDTGPIRIPIIVKAKADGSVAAVRDSLLQLGKESSFDILVDPIGEGVGPLTKSEVEMAKESNACVFCFDVKNQDKAVLALAESEGVKVMEYDVIYSLLDDAKEIFMEFLPPVPVEVVHGKAAVQAVFSINGGKDAIAGLAVTEGTFYKKEIKVDDTKSNVHFRVIRKGERVSPEGETIRASSLRKFKEDVENVRNGEECGLGLEGFIDFQEGDVIECYSVVMKKSFA